MGNGSRRREGTQDMLDELVSRAKRPAARHRDSAADLAESFRKASKALEVVTRDVATLRQRLMRPPSR